MNNTADRQSEVSVSRDFDEYVTEDMPEIHLWDYVQVVLQRLPLALWVLVGVLILTALYTWTRTPRYEARSRLLIEKSRIDLTAIKDVYDPTSAGISQREYLQTRVKLILSRPVAEKTLQATDLISDPAFAGSQDPVAKLMAMLVVEPIRNSQLIDVSIQGENPKQAAEIVNAVVKTFREENSKRRMGVSEEGLVELRKKAEELREKLDKASRELHSFMAENKMVSFEKAQNIVVERLRDLNKNLTSFQPMRMKLQARVKAAEAAVADGVSVDSLPDVIDSPVIRALKLDLARVEQEYAQMFARLGEKHAQVQAVSSRMGAVRTKLALEAAAILSSLRTEYRQALGEEELLKKALAEQEEAVLRLNQLAVEYDLLARSKRSVEKAHDTVIRRIEEIGMNRMGGQGEDVFVISRAEIPTKVAWPRPVRNMAVGFMLAVALAVGLCFFLDYMDTTVKDETDVVNVLGSSVLAGIPDAGKELGDSDGSPVAMMNQPRSRFAEALRSLRSAIAFSGGEHPPRTLMITSALPSEGKSLVAASLAIAEAQAGKKTLLVGADMRKPSLHRLLGLKSQKGLSNLLAQKEVTLEDSIVETNVKGLFLMPSGPIPPNPVELLDTVRFDEVVKEAESLFDVVVFDTPPCLALVDALVMGRKVDRAILIARSFVVPKAAAAQVMRRFRRNAVQFVGVVLNNVDLPKQRYYHYHPYYGYYGRYGAYYSDDISGKE